MAQATFFYDLGSPFAYLTAERLGARLEAHARQRPARPH
jgi:2-hydroxychromene-2-carboxylate isomerase